MADVALGNMPQAIVHFQRSLELNPTDSSVRHNLSLALLQSGDFSTAEKHLARLALEQPNVAAHRARLAWSQWKLGKNDEANRNLEQARRKSPQDPIVQRVEQMIRQNQIACCKRVTLSCISRQPCLKSSEVQARTRFGSPTWTPNSAQRSH